MSTDDDTELRDLVIDSLEKKGVLGKIKAELRATVFLALEENEKDLANGNSSCSSQSQQELSRFLQTEEGILTFSLVKDFLQQFELDFSLAVLDPEVSSPQKSIPRNELGSLLKLYPDSDLCCPLLGLLVARNQGSLGSSNDDENGNSAQVTKNASTENGVEKKGFLGLEFQKEASTFGKSQSETKSGSSILSRLPGEDPFFDDPLPAAKNNSLFFNHLAKPSVPKASLNLADKQPVTQSSQKTEEKNPAKEGPLSEEEFNKKDSFGLSSLRDLPSLFTEPSKPKEGRRQWKDTNPEQREKFLNLTFGSKLGLEDSFPPPIRDEDGKGVAELEPEPSDQSEAQDQEASIEENIEEDLSVLAEDLLNSDISSKEENVTVDKSVSSFSKAGDYDYMENLT